MGSAWFRPNASSWRVRRAAVGRLADAWRSCRRVLRDHVEQQHLAEATDGGEKVVEVVGDRARDAPERLDPLRVAQLILAIVQGGAGARAR